MPDLLDMPTAAHVIPFELAAGHVLLDAAVNGRPATLILDTGSSLTTLDQSWAADLGLEPIATPARARGTGDVAVQLATADSIAAGTMTQSRERVALMPFDAVSAAHGRPIHGTLGYSLFARWVTEIDYPQRCVRLYEPDGYQPSADATPIALDLSKRVPLVDVRVTATNGRVLDARLTLDIGTGQRHVVFTHPFAEAHRDCLVPEQGEVEPGAGIGGAIHGRLARLARVDVGSVWVEQPHAFLPDTPAGFFGVTWADGTIGVPVFVNGCLTLDYSRSRAYVSK